MCESFGLPKVSAQMLQSDKVPSESSVRLQTFTHHTNHRDSLLSRSDNGDQGGLILRILKYLYLDANRRSVVQLGIVILMVVGIHFIEAYLLNPVIYASHLKLHPLIVLSVLVVAEHSLGVWGLLLAGIFLLFPHCELKILCLSLLVSETLKHSRAW